MPLMQITSDARGGLAIRGSAAPLRGALKSALARSGDADAPIVIMVHGYKYAPGHHQSCPHSTLLSLRPDPRADAAISWPRHLGFGHGRESRGLGLAFGWPARGTIWQAYAAAERVGADLGALIAMLQRIAPHRPVNLFAHSLGCRVALAALARAPQGTVRTLILLAGAEFNAVARAALDSPAGRRAQILNVTTRENDLFDALMEWLVTPPVPGDRMLGHASLRAPNLVTLQLDHAESLHALRRHGHRIKDPARRICHWSPYARPGVFALYRAILSGQVTLEQLRAVLPDEIAPRWSRLVPEAWLRAQAAPGCMRPTTS